MEEKNSKRSAQVFLIGLAAEGVTVGSSACRPKNNFLENH